MDNTDYYYYPGRLGLLSLPLPQGRDHDRRSVRHFRQGSTACRLDWGIACCLSRPDQSFPAHRLSAYFTPAFPALWSEPGHHAALRLPVAVCLTAGSPLHSGSFARSPLQSIRALAHTGLLIYVKSVGLRKLVRPGLPPRIRGGHQCTHVHT
jgi:hypothetical protein